MAEYRSGKTVWFRSEKLHFASKLKLQFLKLNPLINETAGKRLFPANLFRKK
jgi:hypothetical protein